MIRFLCLLLLNKVYSNELSLTSSRLTVRPKENAYAFGVLSNENIEYFNCTVGTINIYNHTNTINWAWKYKIDYNTVNFTSIINISKNNVLYTKELNINILNYTPRITVDRNIIKAEESTVINNGIFIGNNITVNTGILTTYMNEWNWVGQTEDLFKNGVGYVLIKVLVDETISNEFFIYKNELVFSKIHYYLYIPNYVIENEFIDIVIVSIATSHIFKIDESKIVSKEFSAESKDVDVLYYTVFKITIDFVSEDTSLNINNNIFNYIENGVYFNKIINSNTNYGKNMFLFNKPEIEYIHISSKNTIYRPIMISIIFLIFIVTQYQAIYLYFLINSLKIPCKDF